MKENAVLNHLVDINRDACDFYSSAATKLEDTNLISTFRELESMHSNVITVLNRRIVENGGEADADGTLVGKGAKVFGELMAKVSSDSDETLISHLEEAEDRCLHSLEDAIEEDEISAETRALLSTELGVLKRTHDHMKSLKEVMRAH
jgi:uncharacterized protein (TIGR02284 family)